MKNIGRSIFCATICAVFVLALIAGAWTFSQSPISVAHGPVPPPPPWETNKDADGFATIIAHGPVPPPPPWETNKDNMDL